MNDIIEYFKQKGIKNPLRSIELIKNAIKFNSLNLDKLIVFTEAASREFIYTPIIAAMAGAKKVYAITNDSVYSSKEDVKKDTLLFAELCGVKERIEVVFDKKNINEADIITNLGFVRPINRCDIDKMKYNAVIPYMCEAWEVREEDVDIDYCKEKAINVMGTNEDYQGLEVFNFSGPLALKMLFDSGIEVYKSNIVIVSSDKFGDVIYKSLVNAGANVTLLKSLTVDNIVCINNADALIIADYTSNTNFIGKYNSVLTGEKLKELSQFITVIQFAGLVDIDDLKSNNINYYPDYTVGSFKMGKTLAYLGPKPIIDLHCAGLKVGELMFKKEIRIKEKNSLYQSIFD